MESSTLEIIILPGLIVSATPNNAKLIDSVAPEVITTSLGSASNVLAIEIRLLSN